MKQTIFLLLAVTVFSFSVRTTQAESTASKLPRAETQREILERLDMPVSCQTGKNLLSLTEALKHLLDEAGFTIYLDNPALDEAGISPDAPVQFNFPFPLTAEDALEVILRQHGLGWKIENDIVIVSTKSQADRLTTQTYYVGDLVAAVAPTQNTIQWPAQANTDFDPLMDYLEIMLGKDAWDPENSGGEMMEYYPNLSLVVRQTEENHARIAEILKRIRKVNDIQIPFEISYLPLGEEAFSNTPGKSTIRLTCMNGQQGVCMKGDDQRELYFRVAPVSAQPVEERFMEQNKPFLFTAVASAPIGVTGKVGKKNGRDVIYVTLSTEGRKSETRMFYASPIIQEEEEEFLTGIHMRHLQAMKGLSVATYDVSDLVEKSERPKTLFGDHQPLAFDPAPDARSGENPTEELIDLITAVVAPDSWDEGATIRAEGKILLVEQSLELHAEIEDLLRQLRSLNDQAVGFKLTIHPLYADWPASGKIDFTAGGDDVIERKCCAYNGQTGYVELGKATAHVVGILPSTVPVKLGETVEPMFVYVPEGKKLYLQGIVSQDKKSIRICVHPEDGAVRDRTFEATPLEAPKIFNFSSPGMR